MTGGTPEEIAALAAALQEQQVSKISEKVAMDIAEGLKRRLSSARTAENEPGSTPPGAEQPGA